jgi:hypothetical protein
VRTGSSPIQQPLESRHPVDAVQVASVDEVAHGAGVAERLIDHARQCYAGALKVETEQALRDLPTVGR